MIKRALVEYLVNAVWQLPLLAGGAWLLVRACDLAPRTQHRLWVAVLALAVLMPLRTTPHKQQTEIAGLAERPAEGVRAQTFRSVAAHVAKREPDSWFGRARHIFRAHDIKIPTTTVHWLVGLYLSSVIFGLLRFVIGWRAAQHLVRHASPAVNIDYGALASHSRRFRIELPTLCESAGVSSPVVVGAYHPVLLVPQGFERYSEEEIRAVICHELAHIQRHDYAANLMCQLAALPLIWHPATHYIQQRIRLTREMICDAMAAQEMESEMSYARCLLALAQNMLGVRSSAPQAQLPGLFSRNTLEERVMRLTKPMILSTRARMIRTASGVAIMFASYVAASTVHFTPAMAAPRAGMALQAASALPAAGSSQAPAPQSVPTPAAAPTAESTEKQQEKKDAEKRVKQAESTLNNAELKRQIEKAQEQTLKTQELADSSAFRQQIENAEKEARRAEALTNSPEFKKQMEDAANLAHKVEAFTNSPEFKRQIEQAQQQALKAKELFDSSEFKKQIQDAANTAQKAEASANGPDFKKQMEEALQQARKAKELFDSPAFKKEMEDLKQKFSKDLIPEDSEKKEVQPAVAEPPQVNSPR